MSPGQDETGEEVCQAEKIHEGNNYLKTGKALGGRTDPEVDVTQHFL